MLLTAMSAKGLRMRVAGMASYYLQAALACALLAAAAAQPSVLAPLNLSLRATEPRSSQPAPAQRRPTGSMSQPMAPAQLVSFHPIQSRLSRPVIITSAPGLHAAHNDFPLRLGFPIRYNEV